MNTQSNEIPNSFNARTNQSAKAMTRPFYWSVRRELWENRSVAIVPLAVAAVALFGFLIATIGRALATPDLVQRRAVLGEPYHFVSALIMGAAFIVGIFYSLDALHGERRDRSILFWKSLPVSDLTTVLSKLSIPIVFLPLFSFAIVVVAQLTMFCLSSLAMLGSGMNIGSLWAPLFRDLMMLLYHLLTVHMLWYAPLYAWMVLVSGWARRAVFLWAGLPPLAVFAIEKIAFRTDHFLNFLEYRLSGPEPFDMAGSHLSAMDGVANLSLAKFLTIPGLWAGLAFAALFLFAAARLRRQQGPI
jgi:ABC-2 type transport system permease protein